MKILATILLFIIYLPTIGSGQVRFAQLKSLEQLKEMAKKEHKYLLLDCYATWCAPCKKMDAEVYPDTSLGYFINQLYLVTKVQMDTSAHDDETIQSNYATAHYVQQEYKVKSYPTFLFFSPEGQLIHEYIGGLSTVNFLKECLDARDPNCQEFNLLEQFYTGSLYNFSVPGLIKMLKKSGDAEDADKVAQKYIDDYLLKLPDELLYKKDNIYLMANHLKTSKDKVFAIFYKHTHDINKVTDSNYAERVVQKIITQEEINSRLPPNAENNQQVSAKPDWNAIFESIKEKYGQSYAIQTLPPAKVRWYREKKDWPELISALLEVINSYPKTADGNLDIDRLGGRGEVALNNTLYNAFFLHATDLRALQQAVTWEKLILNKYPDQPEYMDTYAGLLYKSGKKKEAQLIEKKAIEIGEKALVKIPPGDPIQKKQVEENIKQFKDDLAQMKAGKPYWEQVK